MIDEGNDKYAVTAFHYVHQNPLKAGLVYNLEEWLHSSYTDYLNSRKSSLCETELAEQLIGFNKERFKEETLQSLNEHATRKMLF